MEEKTLIPKQDRLLNYKETMRYLRMSDTILRRYIRTGELKAAKFGGKWLFRKSWLDEFIEQKLNAY